MLLVLFLPWISGVRFIQANECYNNATSQEADVAGETEHKLNLTISNLGSTDSLLITWKTPTVDVLGYYLILSELGRDTVLRNESASSSTTSFQFAALAPGTGYNAEVTALFECFKTFSETITEWTRPSPLSEVQLQNPGSSSTSALVAAWADSTGAEWYYLTLYTMLSDAVNQAVSARRGTSNHTFRNLSSGTQFYLRISASSGSYRIMGPNATAWTAPLAPTNVSLGNTGEAESLHVHWQKSSGSRERHQVTLHKVDSRSLAQDLFVGMEMTNLELRGLVPGTQYAVQVTAIAGPYRASSQEAKAWTSPVAPSLVSLTNHGSASELHAHWDGAPKGSYITTFYTVDPFRIIENGSLVRGIANLTFKQLAPGTHYGFEIQTVAGPFISPPQSVTTWTYPLPPAALSLQNEGSSNLLRASWSQPIAGPVPPYAISLFEATSTALLKNMTVSQGSTTVIFEGLVPGRPYTVRVSATAGPYRSFEQTATTWTYPLAPSKVMLTNEGKTSSLYASWDRAPGDRDGYFLQLITMDHQMEKNITLEGSQQNCTVDKLQPGQQYVLQVTAVAGPYQSSSKSVTEWTHPLPMDNVTVINVQTSPVLQVRWTDSGGGGTDRWVCLYSMQSHTLLQNVSVERGATSVTLDNLDPGAQYLVEVVSQAGPYQRLSQKAVGYTYPLSPVSLKLTSGRNSSDLVAQWKNPAGDREGYLISLYKNGESTALRQLTTTSSSTNITLVGLMAGSWYHVEVQAVSGQHYRSVSQNATACTSPTAPANVNLSSRGSAIALYATWTEPAGGRDSYKLILYSARSQGKFKDASVGHRATSYAFHDLPAGSLFTLSIAAVCGPSETFSPNITEWTYPLAPEDLTLSNLGSQSTLYILWKAYPEGQDGYSVSLYEVPSGLVAGHVLLGRDAKSYTFNHLVPGKKYGVEVSATAGPYKATSGNVTDWTYPLTPSSFMVTNDGCPDSLHVSWEEVAGERTGYTVIVYDAVLESVVRNASLGRDARNFTFSGLTPGKKYNVEIISVAGPHTASSGNVTDWTYPVASTKVSMTNQGSSDSLHMFWEEATGQRDSYEAILYDAETHRVAKNVSIRGDAQNFTFSGLSPGRKYDAHIISVAGLYRTLAANATDWTYPLASSRANVTNGGHSDILQVVWEKTSGDRDSYTLTLYDTRQRTVALRKLLAEDIRNFTFTGLTPGNEYTVEIVTTAGPYGRAAANITEWTYPLAPVRVSVTNNGQLDSLHASWEEAAGVRDGYQVVLYDTGQGNVVGNASVGEDTRNVTLSGLTPGAKYSVEVVSVTGPYGVSAENVTDWTYPVAPENVSVVIEEDNTVLVLSWSLAAGLQDSYQVWLLDLHNQTASWSSTVSKGVGHHLFQGLVPGRNYSVSVTSVVGPYRNSSESVLVAVEPMPVSDAQCWTQETVLHLNWSVLRDQSNSCFLAVEMESGDTFQQAVRLVTAESEISLRNLEPNSLYRVHLTAIGKNEMRSQTVTLLCNTSQKVLPPLPTNNTLQFDGDTRVIISEDMFSEENGKIVYYGIIVTCNESLVRPSSRITNSTWYNHYYGEEDTYLAALLPNPFRESERSMASRTWVVPMGTEECGQTTDICNGKLKAETRYRFSVAAFTRYDPFSPVVSFSAFSAPPDSRNTLPVPILAGAIAASFLTVAVLGLVFWKRGRAKRREKSNLSQEMTAYSLRNIHRPISLQTFKQVFEMKSTNACHGFFQEFEELKEVGKDQAKGAAELSANSCKNRYPHVLPYDHSRVKLSQLGEDPSSDYINGNFVPGFTHPQEYIVTQGPLKKTIEDFWRMVWEQNVYNIVMLTVCMENGRVLCDHYWPSDSSPVTYGEITVHLVDQTISNEWTIRELKLWHEDVKLERKVHQLHYTEWPDHGIPASTTSIITFAEMVREHVQAAKGSGPTLVNCSAGVGRSGTFIGLDRLLQQVKVEKIADVFNTIYTMRVNRYLMIQTLGQYIFLHSCILEKITEQQHASKETSRPILQTSFSQYCLRNSANACAGFQQEYEVLMEAAKDETSGGTADPVSINQQTNTYSILPYDRSRIKFSPLDLELSPELASTWFIPGYCSAKDYLAIKGPDGASADQFWRLVWEHSVHMIITLVPPVSEKGQLWCEECWPSDSSPVCASGLAIHLAAMKDVQGWKCSQLKMKRDRKAKERQLLHFCFPLWSDQETPESVSVIQFLSVLRKCTPSRKKQGPLLIHCSTGMAQMGLLVALDCILQQIKYEKSVDVYGVTLKILKSCCLMKPTLDQYMYLYTSIGDVLAQKESGIRS
nr:receptor-type tyrosine-protein phosphatase V-like isoform X2 [Geotrypetes seraphini]XP_033774580.1 receptor-type tyrosine-protein phosphatase V-like isoform X2 [Geotrypetes seraphini]XP_033774581.1 receptor-type tyrosine-protein phosphatase V-like isoform X2 [Geotrypetes seraphini]